MNLDASAWIAGGFRKSPWAPTWHHATLDIYEGPGAVGVDFIIDGAGASGLLTEPRGGTARLPAALREAFNVR